MAYLMQTGKYDKTNTTDTKAMGYCVIKYLSDAFTLQEYTTVDGKGSRAR